MFKTPGQRQKHRAAIAAITLFLLAGLLSAVVALVICGSTMLGISPRPAAFLIKYAFNRGSYAMSAALVKHVPPGVVVTLNERYDASDGDASLDVFYPSKVVNTDAVLPVIVWVH